MARVEKSQKNSFRACFGCKNSQLQTYYFYVMWPTWYKTSWKFFYAELSIVDVILEFSITRYILSSCGSFRNHHFSASLGLKTLNWTHIIFTFSAQTQGNCSKLQFRPPFVKNDKLWGWGIQIPWTDDSENVLGLIGFQINWFSGTGSVIVRPVTGQILW